MPAIPQSAPPTASTSPQQRYGSALSLLASLFFMWGFITVINNTLLPHLRSVFVLDYTRTTLIESVWFIAYFVASIPSAKLIERIGYQKAIVTGLLGMAVGAAMMVPAAMLASYGLVLTALFVIASGITLLQVAANPYVAVIGPPETGSSRLNLVQAFNSLGTTLAPLFAGYLILGRSKSGTAGTDVVLTQAERYADAQSVILPYVIVAIALVLLAMVMGRVKLPAIGQANQRTSREERKKLSLWSHRNLVFGVPAIFIYLIAEIGVANLFINFVSQPNIAAITHEEASRYLAILWGGMMVGRFLGSVLMRRFAAEHVLAAFSIGAFVVMLVAAFAQGPTAMWALIAVGFFHSIMFPTIFASSIKGLGPLTKTGSSFLVMSIIGGAVLTVVMGAISDASAIRFAILVPCVCFAVVGLFGITAKRRDVTAHDTVLAGGH